MRTLCLSWVKGWIKTDGKRRMRWEGLNGRYGMARDGMGLMRRDKLKGRDGMR